MSAINQVIAGIGGVVADSWTYVGVGAEVAGFVLSGTSNYPETAQAGDLAVLFLAGTNDFNTASGFSLPASGGTQLQTRVCTGGETSISWSAGSSISRRGRVALFRPTGGTATLSAGVTDLNSGVPTNSGPLSYGSFPSLLLLSGSSNASVSLTVTSAPAGTQTIASGAVAASHFFGYSIQTSGANTGFLSIDSSGVGHRQTFATYYIV